MMRQNKARLPGCGSQPHTQFKMLSLIHSRNTPLKPPAPLSLMQTYFQTLRRTQAGLSAWLFQLSMSSARCSLCPLLATVPGSHEQRCPGVWREGLPGAWDGGSEAQPGRWQAGPSSRQRSGKGSNSNLMAGCYPLAGRDTATLTRVPLPQRAAEPVPRPQPPPLSARALSMATGSPRRARLIPEDQWRFQSLSMSKYPAKRSLN